MSPRTEEELLDATIDLATRCRWAVHHDRPAIVSRDDGDRELRGGPRWATAIAGHAGFPDLVLARRGVVLFRELKGYQANGRLGRLSSEQRDWGKQLAPDWPLARPNDLAAGLDQAGNLRAALLFDVWTPDDWDLIVATLTTKTPAVAR